MKTDRTGACCDCGRPFSWEAPSEQTGQMQGWYRQHELTATGKKRCADRNNCKNYGVQPGLF